MPNSRNPGRRCSHWFRISLLLFVALFPFRAEARVPAETSLRLVFVGDIMVHKDQLAAARVPDGYDFHPQFRRIAPFLEGDLVVGNLETVLGGAERRFTGYPAFNTPDALAKALREAGFHVLLLANNHIMDRGAAGAARTVSILAESGLLTTGVFPPSAQEPRPLLLRAGGMRIGLLNATYGMNAPLPADALGGLRVNTLDRDRIGKDIDWLLEQGAEYLVAAFHWGVEYRVLPDGTQRSLADFCLERGVDLIVGSHPHVLQPLEVREVGGKPRCIAWSLGNFISCQRTLPRERALILQVELARPLPGARPELRAVRVMPTWVELKRLADGGLRLAVNAALEPLHDALGVPAETERETHSPLLRKKLAAVNRDVLKALGLAGPPDPDGFYTLWAR